MARGERTRGRRASEWWARVRKTVRVGEGERRGGKKRTRVGVRVVDDGTEDREGGEGEQGPRG